MGFLVAQSILQLWLLVSQLGLAGSESEITSCEDGAYLAEVDRFQISRTVWIPQEDIEMDEKVNIFIGNKSFPTLHRVCTLYLSKSKCIPGPIILTCSCTYLGFPAKNHEQQYDINVLLPLVSSMNSYHVYVKLEMPSSQVKDLFRAEIPVIYGTENVTIAIDGRKTNIVNLRCPDLPLKQTTTIRFCVSNLQSPSLRIHFDDVNDFVTKSECAEKTMAFKGHHLGKTFWLSFWDTCNRHGTIMCRFPTECCRASLPAPVTLTLMIALTMSSLLTQVN